ncbi:MAG: VWA domain-containing protein [Clostridia bacterium]|nr:VWA domain-containing protein [Clostridia bacterium]
MTFTYPLGLLGLLGIPVIILIYILQSTFSEQTVNSNFIWHLSDKFMKRKNPLSGIAGIISLILQLLMVVVITMILSKPVFTLKNAANEYYFVLDSSSSMTMVEGEESRFEIAKNEIEKIIKNSKNGSTYSVICVSNDEAVYEFDKIDNKKTAINLMENLKASHTSTTHLSLLNAAQRVFDDKKSALVYLITDKDYEVHENIEIIDVGNENVENYGIFDVEYLNIGGYLKVNATAISYVSDKTLNVKISIDGNEIKTSEFDAKAGEATPVEFNVPCKSFSNFEVQIVNEDGYVLDNSITVHNLKGEKTYSVLIVSETEFFFKAIVDALVDSEIDVVSPSEYENVSEEYGLYIFDSFAPNELPNGAVWLVNVDKSIENSGFGVRGKIALSPSDVIEKSKSTATNVRNLLKGVGDSEIYLTDYIKYSGMYLNFHTLYSYDSNPLIFAGANGLGNRQVVFGFDIHKSDFALTTDFVMLMRNLIEYSFPNVIDETSYIVGEDALVNILKNAENYKAKSPSGKDIYIETDGATSTIALTEIGTYEISLTFGGNEMKYQIYSGANEVESQPAVNEKEFSLSGEKQESDMDGKYDPTIVFFICLAVLFIADWGVYCYEKYQLR